MNLNDFKMRLYKRNKDHSLSLFSREDFCKVAPPSNVVKFKDPYFYNQDEKFKQFCLNLGDKLNKKSVPLEKFKVICSLNGIGGWAKSFKNILNEIKE